MIRLGCYFCGEIVERGAVRCPYCGEQFAPPSQEEALADQIDIERLLENSNDLFTFAYLHPAELRGAHLSGIDLFNADLVGADLRSADLSWANLSNANLSGADLSRANLIQADMSRANLTGANLLETNLISVNLNGALYNAITRWPPGFDPKQAGAIKITTRIQN